MFDGRGLNTTHDLFNKPLYNNMIIKSKEWTEIIK